MLLRKKLSTGATQPRPLADGIVPVVVAGRNVVLTVDKGNAEVKQEVHDKKELHRFA
jgi:hypothetical protein